jgi:hypothetical protein
MTHVHSLGLPCTRSRSLAASVSVNTQRLKEIGLYIHARGGIRTHNPSKQAAADPRLDRATTKIGTDSLSTR